MKILEVIPRLQSGGAEKFVVDFSNEFIKTGNDCTLVTMYDLDSDDILSYYINDRVKKHSLGKRSGFDLRCLFRLYRYVRDEKPDVVHAHVGAITYLILVSLLYRKCKYYATIHSEARREAGSGINKFIRFFLFQSRLVVPVTISEESEKSFFDFYGISGNMIPIGCSPYEGNCSIEVGDLRKDIEYLFIHAGRLQRVKNQLSLVRGFERLVKDGVRARLIILGRKEDICIYNELQKYFTDNIVYLGEQSDCRSYMANCDAFCLSSTMEGMPITIIEAFSVGCIPIVTPVGGCVTMIENGTNGILADDVSEEAIYKAMRHFVNLSKKDKMIMSENALNTFNEKYTISRTVNRYISLFEKL